MSRFDWHGLMRAGLHGLRLPPEVFWQLSPAELAMMLGIGGSGQALSRTTLQDLMTQFPDHGVDEEANDG